MYAKEFIKLGQIFKYATSESILPKNLENMANDIENLRNLINTYNQYNGWFSSDFVKMQLNSLAEMLEEQNINRFSQKYDLEDIKSSNKRVKLIPAGNIPLVGFHDILCILTTGNHLIIKHSQKDTLLPKAVLSILCKINPDIKRNITEETDQRLDFDAIIATGSNNSSRYFDYYFSKYPHIIRKNRNSVAILTGKESDKDLKFLADDIFTYYGLGCRNVSKIYVPKGYSFDSFFKNIYHKSEVIKNAKYSDNYDYNKAIYLMSEAKMLDNGFLILKEDDSISSPPGTLFWQSYDNINELQHILQSINNELQCIVSNQNIANIKTIPFGTAQKPTIFDFADGIDTVEFLKSL